MPVTGEKPSADMQCLSCGLLCRPSFECLLSQWRWWSVHISSGCMNRKHPGILWAVTPRARADKNLFSAQLTLTLCCLYTKEVAVSLPDSVQQVLSAVFNFLAPFSSSLRQKKLNWLTRSNQKSVLKTNLAKRLATQEASSSPWLFKFTHLSHLFKWHYSLMWCIIRSVATLLLRFMLWHCG